VQRLPNGHHLMSEILSLFLDELMPADRLAAAKSSQVYGPKLEGRSGAPQTHFRLSVGSAIWGKVGWTLLRSPAPISPAT
jgi:hypothetical protein